MKINPSGWTIGAMAFASGILLGIAGGLLWAPQSGKRMRKDLQEFATDTLDQAEEWMNTTKESFSGLFKKEEPPV